MVTLDLELEERSVRERISLALVIEDFELLLLLPPPSYINCMFKAAGLDKKIESLFSFSLYKEYR